MVRGDHSTVEQVMVPVFGMSLNLTLALLAADAR